MDTTGVPEKPEGVIIIDIVGGRHPVDVVWTGMWDADRCAIFVVDHPITYPIHRIEYSKLPGMTTLNIPRGSAQQQGRFN